MKETPEEKRAHHAARMREYVARNRDKINARKRELRAENIEKEREKERERYRNNPDRPRDREKQLAASREWKKNNPEKVRELKRRDYEKHKAKRRAKSDEYYEKNKERLVRAQREWYQNNKESVCARAKQRRDQRPEFYNERRRLDRRLNRAKHAWFSTRKSAKNLGVEFDLTVEWFQEKLNRGVCEMSGLPFDMETTKHRSPNCPSIDRRDPKGSYTKANCRLILWFINRAMMDLGEDYCMKVFRGIVKTADGL